VCDALFKQPSGHGWKKKIVLFQVRSPIRKKIIVYRKFKDKFLSSALVTKRLFFQSVNGIPLSYPRLPYNLMLRVFSHFGLSKPDYSFHEFSKLFHE
jgi:hypothetical protein